MILRCFHRGLAGTGIKEPWVETATQWGLLSPSFAEGVSSFRLALGPCHSFHGGLNPRVFKQTSRRLILWMDEILHQRSETLECFDSPT